VASIAASGHSAVCSVVKYSSRTLTYSETWRLHRPTTTSLGGGLLSGFPRLATGLGTAPPDSCGLPTTWNQDVIAAPAWPPGAGSAFILAWDVIEDERTPPLRIESCRWSARPERGEVALDVGVALTVEPDAG
jgi:hypothetical protein